MRRFVMLVLAVFVSSGAAGQAPCPSRLYVSGFFSTVHVFDACTGAFVRDLDGHAHLDGAMAVRLGPDRRIYAVSEETATILRYRNDTLAWDGAYVNTPPGSGPTGLAFDAVGNAWVAAFDQDNIRRYAPDGTAIDVPVTRACTASMALPPFFSPVCVGDRYYIDAGAAQARALLPHALRAAGRTTEARTSLRELADVALYPHQSLATLAEWSWLDGDHDAALAEMAEAIMSAPDHRRGRLRTRRAEWLLARGETAQARSELERAVVEDPGYARSREVLDRVSVAACEFTRS